MKDSVKFSVDFYLDPDQVKVLLKIRKCFFDLTGHDPTLESCFRTLMITGFKYDFEKKSEHLLSLK